MFRWAYFYKKIHFSTTNSSAKREVSIADAESENPMENQVEALQQAVALLQMGNMLAVDTKRDIGEKMNNTAPQIPAR